jgi:CDP-paratose 2-epimerase
VREGLKYTVIGYKGKQVRDNIHAEDLAQAIWIWQQDPRPGAVYNMGGGRENSCSILEAIESMTRLAGKSLNWDYNPQHRKGDHVWWITDTTAFGQDYPRWSRIWDLQAIYESILGGEK